ncbi:AraC family transcriptional regulator [Paenibacillus glycanilyticus]|uniref:HTH-type transcriptional regulator YisR n=1 Tax=Paenibacillus glycanilyticus TaxID=126569 RepID=A0ABQ6GNC7_9BACL|nr:AraC family transcriptional regulator [Paenibacillus glycanilyticus]GLX70938.1 putative HTH-type transcriptional regulator YisR [Paenibacillus glycanilyticus]
MNTNDFVRLQTPPLPYYWESGRSEFRVGDRHPNRRNLGIFDLIIVAEGELFIGENGQEWALGRGDSLLLLPDGEHYSVKPCEQNTVFYWVHFEHRSWSTSAKQGATAKSFANPHAICLPKQLSLADPDNAFKLMRQLLRLTVGDSFWEEQNLLSALLSLLESESLNKTSTPATRLAEKAAFYIQQNFRDDITSEILAEELHFHPNYIVRCMKKKYGLSPSHYLLEFRLEQAKKLLLTSEWTIERIADEVGFRYAPYFSACFKRREGVSPLRYRKSVQK